MKKHILSILSFMVILSFTACASDETTQGEKQESISEGVTSFVMGDDNEITRTTGEYDGSGINFYWTSGDRLWINTGTAASPILKRDDKNSINRMLKASTVTGGVDRTATAKFYFNGTYTAASYPVRYTGRNSTVGDKVTIKAQQTQSVPNDASHIGESGDCGTATAVESGGKYKFNLDHKAAYITFRPHNSFYSLAFNNARLQNIEVSADEAICGEFDFDDNGIVESSRPVATAANRSIRLYFSIDSDFKISYSPTYSPIIVIAPGTYNNFTVKYNLHSIIDGVDFFNTFTKNYGTVTFTAGKNKMVQTELKVNEYSPTYYMWGALNNYWHGYESEVKIINGYRGENYPKDKFDFGQRWYNIYAGAVMDETPNINEYLWYAEHGDPHWDEDTPWVVSGKYIYTGGVWLKRKSQITGYSDAHAPDGIDYSMGSVGGFSSFPIKKGRPSDNDLGNYFFLPALGNVSSGTFENIGYNASYWSGTSDPYTGTMAYAIGFSSTNISIYFLDRAVGLPFWNWRDQ